MTETRLSTLASNETPGSRKEATGDDVVLTHTPIRRKVKKTHNELHEEVFRTGSPVKGLVEQFIGQPLGGYQGRSRVRSGTIREDFAPKKSMSSSSPLPPVPPLPALNQASPRITFPRTRELTHPEVSHGPRRDQPKQSHHPRDSLVLEKVRLIDNLRTLREILILLAVPS